MGITQGMGACVQRVEDPRYLRGRTSFLDGMAPPGMLTAAFVRSTDAHAHVRRIDTADALALPGVHDVLTAEVNGVGPLSSRTFRSALARASARIDSRPVPRAASRCNGVRPAPSRAFGSAPPSSRTRTFAPCP